MEREHGVSTGKAVLRRAFFRMASLKLAIALLVLIALVCVAATVVPQHPAHLPEEAALLDRLLGLVSPFDIFHSAWLGLPSLLLGLSLLACMILGIRSFLRSSAIPAMPAGPCHEEALPPGTDLARVQEDLSLKLGRTYKVRKDSRGRALIVFGERGHVRAIAPMLAHGGILAILLGAALGTLGYKGFMEIPEGGVSDVVTLDGGGEMRLPFSVRCERFSVEYYPNGMPREYRSDLAFTKQGKADLPRALMVNHPVRFEGILFSQSGFNPVLKAQLGVRKGNTLYHALAEEKTYFILDEEKYQVNVVRLLTDVMRLGPAAELIVDTPQGQKHLWVFKNIDKFRARFPGMTEKMAAFDPASVSPYTFTLESMTERSSTVLSINRDPGEAFVAAGSLLFMAGLFIIFLVPSGLVWVSLSEEGHGVKVKTVRTVNGRICGADGGVIEHLENLKGGRS
jgi:cytochrome c biogenesis protein